MKVFIVDLKEENIATAKATLAAALPFGESAKARIGSYACDISKAEDN